MQVIEKIQLRIMHQWFSKKRTQYDSVSFPNWHYVTQWVSQSVNPILSFCISAPRSVPVALSLAIFDPEYVEERLLRQRQVHRSLHKRFLQKDKLGFHVNSLGRPPVWPAQAEKQSLSVMGLSVMGRLRTTTE